MYIPTKVKSIDSLLQRIRDRNGCDIIITPNPSYAVCPNSLQSGKASEYQYDYVQIDDGLVQHDKIVGSTAPGGLHNNPVDNVTIDPNPSYSLPQGGQDVKLEDNPSYNKLQL